MAHRLGRFEVDCDCPPYPIVKACRQVGIVAPEDVRWCRMSNLPQRHAGWRDMLAPQTWKKFLGKTEPEEKTCLCGQGLPRLDRCTFTLSTGRDVVYILGQCLRCRSIFWEKV